MTFRPMSRSGLLALVAALMTSAPVLAAGADDAGAKPPPPPSPDAKQARRVEAMEILRDFNELANSLKAEKAEKARDVDVRAKFSRPARTIHKTTFDSEAIDALLEKAFTEAKVAPAKLTGDEEFIRRVTLDLTGRLPTPEQVVRFRKSQDRHKRAELIDALLADPEYGLNWARYFRDVIRFHATAENPGLIRYPMLEDYLASAFNKNRPWDVVATELITSTGSTGENGSTVLIAAHQGQAVELAGEVSRVFLGIQIQCAQCHDHPSDQWKRQQFHEFAAFFAGIQARRNAKGENGPSFDIVNRNGRVNYTMPDLKDPQKNIPLAPKFFLASESEAPLPGPLTAAQRRELVASYITGQDNPWFARAFVNRVWTALLGDGFYNPVDDLGPGREARNAEVIDALAQAWQSGGYDVRWLFRTILNTKAYQREFRPSTVANGRTPFAANCPSRLRADQIIDSLTHALKIEFADVSGMNRKGIAKPKQGDPKILAALAQRGRGGPRGLVQQVFGVDPSIPADDILGTIPQALYFMNSPAINGAISAKGRDAVLTEILAKSPNDRVALEALYLRVLARSPSADEVRTCGKYLGSTPNRREAFEDILWALVNSTEFLSRK